MTFKQSIECDNCSEIGAISEGYSPMELFNAKRDLMVEGWSFRKDSLLCPKCFREARYEDDDE